MPHNTCYRVGLFSGSNLFEYYEISAVVYPWMDCFIWFIVKSTTSYLDIVTLQL